MEVEYSAAFGRIKILVDGQELTDSQHYWLGPKSFQFNIGDTETHKAELKIGTYGHKFELYIDGKLEGKA